MRLQRFAVGSNNRAFSAHVHAEDMTKLSCFRYLRVRIFKPKSQRNNVSGMHFKSTHLNIKFIYTLITLTQIQKIDLLAFEDGWNASFFNHVTSRCWIVRQTVVVEGIWRLPSTQPFSRTVINSNANLLRWNINCLSFAVFFLSRRL